MSFFVLYDHLGFGSLIDSPSCRSLQAVVRRVTGQDGVGAWRFEHAQRESRDYKVESKVE